MYYSAATTSQTSNYVAKYLAKADKLEKELKMLEKVIILAWIYAKRFWAAKFL